jgi:outer membrane protein assembly factor BamB
MLLRLGLILTLAPVLYLEAQPNVLTYHNDVERTGRNLAEIKLTPSNVNSATFGKIFQISLDGVVDAQPLYVADVPIPNQGTHNVLVVATENDTLYALDADTGEQLWKLSLLAAGETASDDRGCGQVTPQIGITSTPVIRLNHGTIDAAIFAVAMTKDSSGNYHQRLHKVGLATGKHMVAKVDVAAKYPGTGEDSVNGYATFDPKQYKERSGLLLLNGVVYLAWASHCDIAPYTGWIMGYRAANLASVSVIDVTPNGAEGAIWGAGAGLAADATGFIYFLDANGTFDTTLNAQGFPSMGDYGNAFIKLSAGGGGLAVTDYFTMSNTSSESNKDVDLGSGGALVLPNQTDVNGKVQHLAIGAGKDTNIYLVNRDNMGKFNSQEDNAIYQELDGVLPGGIWSMPAYYNGWVYFGAVGGPIRAFQFRKGRLTSTPTSMTPTSYAYPGATPSISANGSAQGILWAVENNSTAVLHAYTANNLAQELYNSSQAAGGRDDFGAGNKYMVPTIANGKVYVGMPNGVVAFGLLGQ